MDVGQTRRAQALRRYPGVAYLAGATALALLLPSGLTVPQTGPPTLAEFAPVPGQGAGRSDLSAFGEATTGGLGSGPGTGDNAEGAAGGGDEFEPGGGGGPGRRKPGNKNCVGDRQTEDPLSPPCSAFFEGDNFGSTAKGVTASEVSAVMWVNPNNGAVSTDPGSRLTDCGLPPSSEDNGDTLLCKAYMKFFNSRYQTYGRTVRLWAAKNMRVSDIKDRLDPFIYAGGGSEAAREEIVSPNYGGLKRSLYQETAPYLLSFRPDIEDVSAITASFVCRKLAGRTARYAGETRLQGMTRKFALWGPSSGRNDFHRALEQALRDQCGVEVAFAESDDATAPARFSTDNVTSVIIEPGNNSIHAAMTRQASQAGYYPEWIVPDFFARGLTFNTYGRLAEPTQWQNAIAITFDYRRGAFTDQMWYRAYKEGCPDCPAPTGGTAALAAETYDAMAMLFYGIQAAGPRLTAQNVARGLQAIRPRPSPDPWTPAAYFGPGNYSYVKDAMAMRWDPSATPPTGPQPGCYRVVDDGRRYRAGEWPEGDGDLAEGTVCQGDTFPTG